MAIMEVLLNPGDTGAEVGALHEQLRNVGAVLDAGEQTTANYGPSTVAAVRAFRVHGPRLHVEGLWDDDCLLVEPGPLRPGFLVLAEFEGQRVLRRVPERNAAIDPRCYLRRRVGNDAIGEQCQGRGAQKGQKIGGLQGTRNRGLDLL